MKNSAAITREKVAVKENLGAKLNRVGVKTVGISSALIGCWAVACLTAGMISSGGPLTLVSLFITAVTG